MHVKHGRDESCWYKAMIHVLVLTSSATMMNNIGESAVHPHVPLTTNTPIQMNDQGPDFEISPVIEASKSICTDVWVYRADNSLSRSGMNLW